MRSGAMSDWRDRTGSQKGFLDRQFGGRRATGRQGESLSTGSNIKRSPKEQLLPQRSFTNSDHPSSVVQSCS